MKAPIYVGLPDDERDRLVGYLIQWSNEIAQWEMIGNRTDDEVIDDRREVDETDRDIEQAQDAMLPVPVADLRRWIRKIGRCPVVSFGSAEAQADCLTLIDRLKWRCRMAELRAKQVAPPEPEQVSA